MPHDESWITILLGRLYDRFEAFGHSFGWPFNEAGVTWIGGEHIGMHHVALSLFVLLLLFLVGSTVARRLRNPKDAIVPEDRFSLFTAVELIVGSAYKMMSDMMGPKAARFFLPLIGALAFFILFSNALGLVPGMAPPTDNLNTTLGCALVVLVVTHYYGIKENGFPYFKHFLGPIWWLIPLMLPLETLTHLLIRPGTLAVRLGANMTADHQVLAKFLELPGAFIIPYPALIYMLGVIVVVVQTLVFCLLSTVYIAQAISHEEH